MVRLRGESAIDKDSSLLLAFIMCKVLGEGKKESIDAFNRSFMETSINARNEVSECQTKLN